MSVRLSPRPYATTAIAATGDGRFVDFRPYVAAVADDGRVLFQAALASGGSGVYSGDGAALSPLIRPGDGGVSEVVSHPSVDGDGAVCCYARIGARTCAVVRSMDGAITTLGDADRFAEVGPLGPTSNRRGAIGFRARARAGLDGVFVSVGGHVTEIARTGDYFASFDGLPVVTDDDLVVFRATRADDVHGVYACRDGAIDAVVETGDRFAGLGRFPVARAGAILFQATASDGSDGIFAATGGVIEPIVDSRAGFESFRGANLDDQGNAVFYATALGGELGVYCGADPIRDRVIGIGDPMDGSTCRAFALNPVSINAHGQLAIRVELTDGRQSIVRADPG